jgi:hypothetical protein
MVWFSTALIGKEPLMSVRVAFDEDVDDVGMRERVEAAIVEAAMETEGMTLDEFKHQLRAAVGEVDEDLWVRFSGDYPSRMMARVVRR